MRYLLPFSYFLQTRLLKGNMVFHLAFEWIAAVLLVVLYGRFGLGQSLAWCLASYIAFISLYEIGYLGNDFFSAKREEDGRMRGPEDVPSWLITLWIVLRLLVFLAITFSLGQMVEPQWWAFFVGLCIVFAIHNTLKDKEKKLATFAWLCWFRFMAPIFFVLRDEQLMGVSFAAALTYVGYRSLVYMDSKDLLIMPSRRHLGFQRFFFLIALPAALALASIPQARGAVILIVYFSVAACLGSFFKNSENAQS